MISRKVINKVKKNNFPSYYSDGAFFQPDGDSYLKAIAACREEFESYLSTKRMFGFSSKGVEFERVHDAWMEIEKKLKLKKKSTFHRCDEEHAFVIDPNPMWIQNVTTRGVMTLLMRSLGKYYDKDLVKSLKSYPLASRVVDAVLYFLDGHTHPTYSNDAIGSEGGFVYYFCGENNCKPISKETLGLYLIYPPKK